MRSAPLLLLLACPSGQLACAPLVYEFPGSPGDETTAATVDHDPTDPHGDSDPSPTSTDPPDPTLPATGEPDTDGPPPVCGDGGLNGDETDVTKKAIDELREAKRTFKLSGELPWATWAKLGGLRAAKAHDADVVALSFTAVMAAPAVLSALRDLRRQLPARTALWVGGHCPVLYQRPLGGVLALSAVEQLPAEVARWRSRAGQGALGAEGASEP